MLRPDGVYRITCDDRKLIALLSGYQPVCGLILADDAKLVLAVSNRMASQLGRLTRRLAIQLTAYLSETALSGMGEINDIIQRMRELSIRAANGTFANADRQNSQMESKRYYRNHPNIRPNLI